MKGETDRTWMVLIALLIVVVGMEAVYMMERRSHRHPDRRGCRNDLKQYGLALHNYFTTQGSWPPAAVVDRLGIPRHSWQALLFPYLEQGPHCRYSIDEPWDTAYNLRITAEVPSWARCRACPDAPPYETNYLIVCGPGFVYDSLTVAPRPADIADDLADTILLVECTDTGIRWTEPRVMVWDEFVRRFDERRVGRHPDVFLALFADGHADFLSYGMDRELLHALFTKSGGEDDMVALRKTEHERIHSPPAAPFPPSDGPDLIDAGPPEAGAP